MSKSYRALISMPIAADGDEDAENQAVQHANSLRHPGSDVISGHVELLIEVQDGGLEPERVLWEDPGFRQHLP